MPLSEGVAKKQVSRSQASARFGFTEARLLQGLASSKPGFCKVWLHRSQASARPGFIFLLIYLRNILEIFLNLLITHLIVLQITIEIAFVRWHINQAMT